MDGQRRIPLRINNGLNINVSREEFIKKPETERSWMLFEGIIGIDKHGCKWERGRWYKAYPFILAAAFVGGALMILVHSVFNYF